jgi:hypothetical protein
MFRALVAHLQEALLKLHLVYCVRVMYVGCSASHSFYYTEKLIDWSFNKIKCYYNKIHHVRLS